MNTSKSLKTPMRMFLTAALMSGVLLTVIPHVRAGEEAASGKFVVFGDAYQFVFHSVLEGLFRDGASQTDIERILMKQSPQHGYEHFIYSCEICTSVLLAVQLYEGRPSMNMYKGPPPNKAFGPGLPSDATAGLASGDVKVRLTTIHALVSRWIEERFDRMHMPEAERETYRRAFENGREQGMRALQSFQKSPELMKAYAPGYAGLNECALCNAAAHMDFK